MASEVKASGAQTAGAQASVIKPLQPLIDASRTLGLAVAVLIVWATVATIFGSGSVLTIGDDPICTAVSASQDLPMPSIDVGPHQISGLAAGVNVVEDQYQLCQDRPSGLTQVLSALAAAPEMVLLLGFLAGVFLLVRRARRYGLFSRPVARVVHWLGWFVLAGALVASTAQALATSGLVRQMIPAHGVLDFTGYWQVSISTLLAGAGILTIARVLRLTVEMQEDLDATI
jgi:hypothetical protein